jgi:hypothetical protein
MLLESGQTFLEHLYPCWYLGDIFWQAMIDVTLIVFFLQHDNLLHNMLF